MNTHRTFFIKVLAVAFLLALSIPASADRDQRRGRDGRSGSLRHEGFREHRDIRRFDQHEFSVWRSGRWYYQRHGGRLGWWWVVAGTWYFYPWPVYPYPDPYTPPVIVKEPPAQPLGPPPAQFWYFCTSADGYYPYIPSCPEGWQAVPATLPAAPGGAKPGAPAQ